MSSDAQPDPAELRQRDHQRSEQPRTLLEPPVVLVGRVIHGAAIGRTLGFPTANIRLPSEPPQVPFGIYAARVLGRPAAVSIGVRPTFGENLEPLLEAHILDFREDLYGREIAVELLAYLREEAQFATIDALRLQIALDVKDARAVWMRVSP
jgi:riboflavin kinase/FMN adenylyltransferase